MGSTIVDGDGSVSLHFTLSSAPWIRVDHLNVIRNGVVAQRVSIDHARDLTKNPLSTTLDLPLAKNSSGASIDSWFLVEAIGNDSMFPIVTVLELPPLLLTDAVGSLAGPLGLGSSSTGALQPAHVFPITPYALTNPVWVTVSPGEFHAPGLVPPDEQRSPMNDPGFETTASGRITPNPVEAAIFHPVTGSIVDIRHVLERFSDR